MKKISFFLGIFLLVFFSSCTKETGKVLSVALSQEPVSLDLASSSAISSRMIMNGNVYETLFSLDGEDIVECIASLYSFSNEGKKLSITIKKNVYFSDGTLLTEEDVVSSLNRWLALYPKALELSGGNYFYSSNNSVIIESDNSLLFLLYALCSSPQLPVIMKKEVVQKEKNVVFTHIGTGPYIVKEWKENEKIILERNKYYKGEKKAFFDSIVYYFVPDYLSRILGLKNGKYDVIDNVLHGDVDEIEKNGKERVVSGEESGSIALVFNNKEGLCSNKDVRKGISLLLDRGTLMSSCYGEGGYSLSYSFMEEDQELWKTGNENIYSRKNIDMAKNFLKDYSGEVLRILVPKLSNLDKIAVALSSLLEEGGIKNEIILTDWAGMMEKRREPSSWDIYISSFTRVSVPSLKSYFSPSFPCWIDENSDGIRALFLMEKEREREKIKNIWKEAEEKLYEECAVYISGHYKTEYGISNKIKGETIKEGIYFYNAEFI